jgi:hypothetical protein
MTVPESNSAPNGPKIGGAGPPRPCGAISTVRQRKAGKSRSRSTTSPTRFLSPKPPLAKGCWAPRTASSEESPYPRMILTPAAEKSIVRIAETRKNICPPSGVSGNGKKTPEKQARRHRAQAAHAYSEGPTGSPCFMRDATFEQPSIHATLNWATAIIVVIHAYGQTKQEHQAGQKQGHFLKRCPQLLHRLAPKSRRQFLTVAHNPRNDISLNL